MTIKILQVNTGRGGPAQEAALHQAQKGGYDVVIIQEPMYLKESNLTKTHKKYKLF